MVADEPFDPSLAFGSIADSHSYACPLGRPSWLHCIPIWTGWRYLRLGNSGMLWNLPGERVHYRNGELKSLPIFSVINLLILLFLCPISTQYGFLLLGQLIISIFGFKFRKEYILKFVKEKVQITWNEELVEPGAMDFYQELVGIILKHT